MSAPAAPTGVLASAGFGCAQLQWTAPVSSGTVPQATSYTVTASPADVAAITLVAPTGGMPPVILTVGGLNNGTAYTFTVTATNQDGTSPASTPSAAVTPIDFGDGLTNTLSYLTGELSNDYLGRLGQNPPTMWIGPQYLANRDDGQRLVFVPMGGQIVPGELLGDGLFTPRQLWDTEEIVEAHIWGLQLPTADPMQDTLRSIAQARRIANCLLATLHRITLGSNIAVSEAFPAGREKTTRGAALIVRFQLKIPVVHYPPSTGVITAIDFVPSL